MILSYLYSIGISVVITSNVSQYCSNVSVNGCYLTEEKVIITNGTKTNFWHEVGHALFYKDEFLLKTMTQEQIADSYASYIINNTDLWGSNWRKENPELSKYFYKKL